MTTENNREKTAQIIAELYTHSPVFQDIVSKISTIPSTEKITLASALLEQAAIEIDIEIDITVKDNGRKILKQHHPLST